jgi:hypothetical protein
MTLAVAIVLALLGIGVIVFGLGYYIFFRIGLTLFERSLKSEIAEAGRGHVDRAVMAITNPKVRRVVADHLVGTGGAAAAAVARNVLKSRKRTGLYVAALGLIMFIASFFTGAWLPIIWKAS